MMKQLIVFLLLSQVTQGITDLGQTTTTPSMTSKASIDTTTMTETIDHAAVSSYYGKTLKQSADLKTNACCSDTPPKYIRDLINKVHDEVVSKYYGCGLCIPDLLEGKTILDLGCGAGRDVYIASQLAGPLGKVIGIDMTDEQLDVAKKHKDFHSEEFGYDNIEFYKGFLEQLEDVKELQDDSIDIIISNCVINLCMDKEAVLKSCHRLLKQGGELYFSDVYCNKRVPESLRKDAVLWGECLSGALYWNDFVNLAKSCGFDPRLVEDSIITIQNKDVIEKAEKHGLKFYSATYRLFKIDDLEPDEEDYDLSVKYRGTIPRHENSFQLDSTTSIMETGKMTKVCGNTYKLLKQSRFSKHFIFSGNFDIHYGIFDQQRQRRLVPFTSEYSNDQNSKASSCCPSDDSSAAASGCC